MKNVLPFHKPTYKYRWRIINKLNAFMDGGTPREIEFKLLCKRFVKIFRKSF